MDDEAANKVTSDLWSEFVLDRQFGNDPKSKARLDGELGKVRDRILDSAHIRPGNAFLDLGAGQGLLGFGAIDRLGPAIKVVFADVSGALLEHCRRTAAARGVDRQCRFLQTSASRLTGITDGSIDVAATRASLAFVPDRAAAFAELFRVLKPGGRLSISEPVNQDEAFATIAMGRMLESEPDRPDREFVRLLHRYRSIVYPATEAETRASPVCNFSERDLFHQARQAGFSNIHLELHLDYRPQNPIPWDQYLVTAVLPGVPTAREILRDRFDGRERRILESGLRPMVESNDQAVCTPVVFLTADKRVK